MSKLILMRHGQASFGEQKYDELSELGRQQARATGLWMQAQANHLDAVLCGPRSRQQSTAIEVLNAMDCAHSIRPAPDTFLDEFAEGEEIFKAAERRFGRPMLLRGERGGQRSHKEVLQDYDALCRAWADGEVGIEGRASNSDFQAELANWLDSKVRDAAGTSGQHILVVTSAGVIAALVRHVLGLPASSWYSLLRVVRNASLSEILYSKDRCSLLSFNGTAHLPASLHSSM
ncbi:MAG TPA: histidine phosphatase family protein [Limnobacter sp.]|nr:histidine phosphatase family protein [Limnobacter sp.]